MEIFYGKSKVCDMTLMSEAFDKSVIDGNTILLKISEDKDRHRCVDIGGDTICSFQTNDNVNKHLSNMGKNLTPYSMAVGDKNIFF